MKLTSSDVTRIAFLARLSLTEGEKTRYAEQLSTILDYVEMLQKVPTSSVEETCQVTGLEDCFREDMVVSCDEETIKKLIAAFPEKSGNLLKVKAVFDA